MTGHSRKSGDPGRWPLSQSGSIAVHLLGVLATVAAITLVSFSALRVSATAAGLFYAVGIVVIARVWGLTEALLSSILAFLTFDYFFLPPVGTFTISRPMDWWALVAFLIAAIAANRLSSHGAASQRIDDRQREMEGLYALSRAILLMDPVRPVAKQVAYQIAQIFSFPAVALYDRASGDILRAGPEDLPAIEDKLRQAAVQGTLFQDAESQTVVTAIRLGGEPIGSIALRGMPLSDGALHALSNLVAIGLERVRNQEMANRVEAARQSQELKSTLMDAIAHEFKTPLTSIKAAATALLSGSVHQPLAQRELVSIIDEEADRLSQWVSEAIQMARVEVGQVQVKRKLCDVNVLVRSALEQMKSAIEGREVRILITPKMPEVLVDGELIGLAIRQLVDNALKYSPPNTPVTLRARTAEGNVILSVADEGAGIEEADQAHIFEKFYRAPSSHDQVTGAGMGLTIARRIVEAHSGKIWLQSQPGQGSEFFISLPIAHQEVAV
jgi:two-component system sensor histidine kinase KdpD